MVSRVEGANPAEQIRIVVVEDEPSLRVDLVDFLLAHGYSVTGLGDAYGFRNHVAWHGAPHLVLLDVNLPDGNGFDLARDLRRQSDCGIVMLTMRSAADDRVEGLESGADAYLVKHASLREIEATIRSVLRRLEQKGDGAAPAPAAATPAAGPAPAPIAAAAPVPVPAPAPAATPEPGWVFQPMQWQLLPPGGAGGAIRLTGSEVAFLSALVERAGKPCPRDEIARVLSRPSLRAEDRSIDALVRRLRRKIEDSSGGEAPIKMVYGIGYSFSAPVHVRES